MAKPEVEEIVLFWLDDIPEKLDSATLIFLARREIK
jgi:hypothetical protein